MIRLGQADKLGEIADGWPPSSEIRLPLSLLGIEALQKLEISIDIKDLACIALGTSLPVGLFDGLDFVHSLSRIGPGHMQCSRGILNFSLGPAITCLRAKRT